jgi:hypothetical protein
MAAHVSKIKKSISRKLSTAAYEALDIHVEIEETIEWDTPEQRMEKTENYTKLLVVDFMKTLDKVTSTLGVDKKVATINKNTGNGGSFGLYQNGQAKAKKGFLKD